MDDPPSFNVHDSVFQETLENFFESEATPTGKTVTREMDAHTTQKVRRAEPPHHENEEPKAGVPVSRALDKSPDQNEDQSDHISNLRYRSDHISNLRGYFYPPITADYTLVATSQDNAGVWVTNSNTRTKVLKVDQWWLPPRDFSKSLLGSYGRMKPSRQTYQDHARKSDKIAMSADSAYLVICPPSFLTTSSRP